MPTTIDLDEVQQRLSQGAQLVDVLPVKEYEQEHLPGAINIPIKTLDGTTAAQLQRDRPVIVYCNDFQ
jgi:rhodanese-related sulfurtransferase